VGTGTHCGDGSSTGWRNPVRAMMFIGGGRTTADSSGRDVIFQLGGSGKRVRRGPIDDEMPEGWSSPSEADGSDTLAQIRRGEGVPGGRRWCAT
jgi:hypothetical protein